MARRAATFHTTFPDTPHDASLDGRADPTPRDHAKPSANLLPNRAARSIGLERLSAPAL